MIIGIPKEIKNNENRVGLVPASVAELQAHGHQVLLETQAGANIGFSDTAYQQAGASVLPDGRAVYQAAEMIVKVKEPQAGERAWLREDQILFTYLHLAADRAQTDDLIASQAICIAYETITSARGGLPLLTPMSEVAGRMSVQAGAQALEMSHGGAGLLLSGVPGVAPAQVLIIGGGIVGSNAARMAVGLRASVTIIDKDIQQLRKLDEEFQGKVRLVHASRESLTEAIQQADLVIGAVLVPGGAAPKLITRQHIATMKTGSVIVDVAIDQGGCCETSHPTTHAQPTFTVDGVVHYCVANMPGAVARTSTQALNNATIPYILTLANKGYRQALRDDAHFRNGLNIMHGKLTCKEVAESLQMPYTDPNKLLL